MKAGSNKIDKDKIQKKDKTEKKGKMHISKHNAIGTVVLLCYAAVVFAVVPGRSDAWSFGMAWFASYRFAWYTMDITAWREIVLNICLFVPFGILLPAAYRRCRKVWFLSSAAGVVIVIGAVQWIAGKGVFVVDDLVNRFAGVVIGYGLFEAVRRLIRKKGSVPAVLCLQLPLLVTLIGFVSLYMVYRTQEFGNLSCHYIVKEDLEDTDIHVQTVFSGEKTKGMVYQMEVLGREEMDERAEQMFAAMGTSMDGTGSAEEACVVYTDRSGSRKIWLDEAGGTYTYTDALQLLDENGTMFVGKPDATRTMIENELERIGISAPEDCAFEDLGNGRYQFIAKRVFRGDYMYDGVMVCDFNINERIARVDNRIRECREYKEVSLRPAKEAYEDVVAGKFSRGYYDSEKIKTMELRDVAVAYMQDTKNFYQPVYEIDVTVNGEETVIDLPALDR